MDTMISPEYIVNILNEALCLDQNAMQKLCTNYIEINEELANHPSIQAASWKNPLDCGEERYPVLLRLGILGLTNGFLDKTGLVICSIWDNGENGEIFNENSKIQRLTGFELRELNSMYL